MRRKLIVTAIVATFASFAASGQQVQETGFDTFETLDANGDGYVARAEAQSNRQLIDRWEGLDTDRDGQLDPAEFSRYELADPVSPHAGDPAG